jgi:hypothetical protein
VVKKKSIFDQFEDLTLVRSGFLEHIGMGGGHGAREEKPKAEIQECKVETVCVREKKWQQG